MADSIQLIGEDDRWQRFLLSFRIDPEANRTNWLSNDTVINAAVTKYDPQLYEEENIEETEDAILQLHKIREMRGIGLPVYMFADCIYRYCVEDERNAFVQQHYIEYQMPGQYMSTSVWKTMDDSYRFFTEKFVPLNHTASERTLNRKIYDKIYSYLKPVSVILVSRKLKKDK